MSEHSRAWLALQGDTVPAALQAAVESAATGAAGDTMAIELADAALLALRDALRDCDDRAAALPLLAADALVTYACQHAANDVNALTALCASLDPAGLAVRAGIQRDE